MNDVKKFAKNEKVEILKETIKIFSQDIEMKGALCYCVSIAFILRLTATNKWINTSFNSNNLLTNTWNNV